MTVELRPRAKEHDYNTRIQKGRSGDKINYNETLKRPSGWMSHVEAAVCAAAEQQEVDGVIYYKCPIKNDFYERKNMAIDHIIPWEQYCRTNADVNDREDVKRAYNDTKNLRLVSKIGNSSKGNRTRVKF